ncbi:MAG: sigma-70 family RNA polymerase sigma factor [Deltaproteobacteria bacterium]|nr:sigma-70 family RNA polymerase sigma factor [Deltaproteobacteria bacterium]
MSDRDRIVELIPRLRRYARALSGGRGEADDLVQDTLARAFDKLHLWRPERDLRVWLFSVMHNLHVDQGRARRARPEVPMGGEALLAPASGGPGDVLERQRLIRALEWLPAPQKQVLLLVALEQLSYDEVARALGIPVGTVMSRLSRARATLRALLAGDGRAPTLEVVR